jgi:hypothetical protein
LSTIVAQELDTTPLRCVEGHETNWPLRDAFGKLYFGLIDDRVASLDYRGLVNQSQDLILPLSRSILGAYARQNETDLRALMGLFGSYKGMLEGCAMATGEAFQLSDWQSLLPNFHSSLIWE